MTFARISVILLLFVSCQSNKEKDDSGEARELFSQSVNALIEYTSKISQCKDSLEIDSIIEKYEKVITDINFSVPSETDFNLTEQENDSIFLLIEIMKRTVSDKFKEFSILIPDSVSE